MELPLPEWMEYVVAGVSIGLGIIGYMIIDRFQKQGSGPESREAS